MTSPNAPDAGFDDPEALPLDETQSPSPELESAKQRVLGNLEDHRHSAALRNPASYGESRDLALGRVRWLRRCLEELGERPTSVLDFGCATSLVAPYFFQELHIKSFLGVAISQEQLRETQHARVPAEARFIHLRDFNATESVDLAYSSRVFHRMPAHARSAAAVLVFRSLAKGGLFAAWERNPWSPGARLEAMGSGHVASSGVGPPETRQLLRGAGFDIVHTTSMFHFPPALSWFRPIEPMLASLPLGLEYMVLARKP